MVSPEVGYGVQPSSTLSSKGMMITVREFPSNTCLVVQEKDMFPFTGDCYG